MEHRPEPPEVISLFNREVRIYNPKRNSYELRYKLGKEMRRETRRSKELAKARAEEILHRLQNDQKILSNAELELYQHIAHELHKANTSLLEVWKFWSLNHREPKRHPLREVLAEFLAAQQSRGVASVTVQTNASRLGRLLDALPANQSIEDVTVQQLDAALLEAARNPHTRMGVRAAAVQLWHWAMTKGYLPESRRSAAENTNAPSLVKKDPQIYRPEEMRLIWQHTKATAPAHLPALAIAAFCGVRSAEISRLQWRHLDLENQKILLPSEITKTHRRRAVTIPDNLMAMLRTESRAPNEPVQRPGYERVIGQARAAHKIKSWTNGFRKSFISYAVGLGNRPTFKIAEESGHSETVLQRVYKGLATEADSEAWFSIPV